ncbi:MAG: type II toxin-antitoxin system VapC family toxin [candidate division KSB1 bacterium]|nr:type II toxin-antitoxin system VapC family toxin [candidate division KSB1 bacterium]MDZ7302260.1 type II toxin-antitoxin system VapC family toxin [candidate division KSB1 bacterium]MDZ7311366.1 type II toxin-antitoxin system VapC family toxin [candidate division KSB1 bacterium]
MNYLCDTNVLSEAMKRQPAPKVTQWLSAQELVYVSVITVEEIYCGLAYKETPKQREWFEKFLRFGSEVLPVTLAIAKRCGELRGNFRKKGVVRTQADLLIAATAYEHNLTLATRNTRDFEDCDIQLFNPFE